MSLFPGILFVLIPVFFAVWNGGLHKVEEGHVGVYFRGGALLKETSQPGFHFAMPFITQVHSVQVSVQTDNVMNIPCGTSGGVVIEFGKIEVVNRLKQEYVYDTIRNYTVDYDHTWIFDKIHHEINQFWSKNTLQEVYIDKFDALDESLQEALSKSLKLWAPGIEIISIRVTKPKIPEALQRSYEAREAERTKLLHAIEEQRVKEKQAETRKKEALIQAQTEAEVSKIEMERHIAEKEANKKVQLIENEIALAKQKADTDARYYKEIKEIEANSKKLTPEYLKYVLMQSLTNNTKMYFGNSIPTYITENIHAFEQEFDEILNKNKQ